MQYVLDAIAGFDPNDKATVEASKYIPPGGYKQFLKPDGLKEKRLGILRNSFFNLANKSEVTEAFEHHIQILRQQGAILVDNLKITEVDDILNVIESFQNLALAAEFKLALNTYLKGLVDSPVQSLEDVITINKNFSKQEMVDEYSQSLFELAQDTNETDHEVEVALLNLKNLSRDGLEKLIDTNKLDAVVTTGQEIVYDLAIGQFPGITVPAGYDSKGRPFGIYFGGLKGSEPKLIEIAYGFEQATKIRKPPSFKP